MKLLSYFAAYAIFGATALLASESKPEPHLVYPGSKFSGFGEAKEETFCIQVSGDVLHPGSYYVPKNASLYSLIMMVGAGAGNGLDGLDPIDATLGYGRHDGVEHQKVIRFAGFTDYDLAKISLDGVSSCTIQPRQSHEPSEAEKTAQRQYAEASALLSAYSVTIHGRAGQGGIVPLPTPKSQPAPEYPSTMRLQGINGLVSVRISVDEKGSVIGCNTVRSTHAEFLAAVKESLKGWTYSPAMKDGKNVPAELEYVFEFTLLE